MNRRLSGRPTGALCALLLLLAACGGGDGDGGGGKREGCRDLALAANEGHALERIEVHGLPDHLGELLAAEVTTADGTSSLTLVARHESSERVELVAPFHPAHPAQGGEVELRIVDAAGNGCAPLPFTIRPLPESPGSTEQVALHLEALIRKQAAYFGTTWEALRESAVEDLPEEHLPLYLAQESLSDPANPNSFAAFLAGTAPALDGAPLDLDLLDRIVGHLGLPAMLEDRLAALDALLDEAPQPAPRHRFDAASTWGPSNAYQLHAEMEMADWGRDHRSEAPAGKVARDISTTVGLVGLVPFAPARAGGMAMGTGLFALLQSAEAAEHLLPSRFVSLDFRLDPASFGEDDPAVGTWSEAMVVAASEGWTIERNVLEGLLQVASVRGGYAEWVSSFAPPGFLSALGGHLQTLGVEKIIELSTDGSDIFTIPPRQTRPIDVTEEPWSDAKISFALEAVGRQGYRLDPSWAGGYEAEIEVRTGDGKFGGRQIATRRSVPIRPLEIVIDPPEVTVEPGEQVEFRITVRHAHDPAVSVAADKGTTVHQPAGGNEHVVHYVAPASEDDLPDLLTVTSESTSGLLGNQARPAPQAIAVIRSTRKSVEITPSGVCVRAGETQAFTATTHNLENEAVTWSTDHGSISASGVYTAPSASGWATVTATSVEDESIRDSVVVTVGRCECAWSVQVTGNPAARFGGEFSTGMVEDGRLEGLFFTLPHGAPLAPAGVFFEFVDGPPGGGAGSYRANVAGSFFPNPNRDADLFGSLDPLPLVIDRIDESDGELIVQGSARGTVYWERLGERAPEHPRDWPGTLSLTFAVRQRAMGGGWACLPF